MSKVQASAVRSNVWQMWLVNSHTAAAVDSSQLLSFISLLNHHQLTTTDHRLGGTSLVEDPHRPIRRDYRGHGSDGVLRAIIPLLILAKSLQAIEKKKEMTVCMSCIM